MCDPGAVDGFRIAQQELEHQRRIVAVLKEQRIPMQRATDRYDLILREVGDASWAGQQSIPVQQLVELLNAPVERDVPDAADEPQAIGGC